MKPANSMTQPNKALLFRWTRQHHPGSVGGLAAEYSLSIVLQSAREMFYLGRRILTDRPDEHGEKERANEDSHFEAWPREIAPATAPLDIQRGGQKDNGKSATW